MFEYLCDLYERLDRSLEFATYDNLESERRRKYYLDNNRRFFDGVLSFEYGHKHSSEAAHLKRLAHRLGFAEQGLMRAIRAKKA